MSNQERQFRTWLTTFVATLHGLTMAGLDMQDVGEGEQMVKVLMEEMREMMTSCTDEQRQLFATELSLLSGLANRDWNSNPL